MAADLLYKAGETDEAFDLLLAVADDFPADFKLRYNLARYACQLGGLKTSWEWLKKAKAIAGEDKIRSMALKDPDLKPLRDAVR